jgi:hypothetical protein
MGMEQFPLCGGFLIDAILQEIGIGEVAWDTRLMHTAMGTDTVSIGVGNLMMKNGGPVIAG